MRGVDHDHWRWNAELEQPAAGSQLALAAKTAVHALLNSHRLQRVAARAGAMADWPWVPKFTPMDADGRCELRSSPRAAR